MQLLRTAIIWVWLAAAGPNCFRSFTTGHQVQVRLPWDVGSVIKHVTGYVTGQGSGHPPKKKERPHHEEYWPPYGYYDPAYYPPYYYPYPHYPPPTYPPMPTHGPTKPPTTKKPSEGTTKKPTETTTNPPTGTTTGAPVTTTVAPVTTTVAPVTTTVAPVSTTVAPVTTTVAPVTTTVAPVTTTVAPVTTTETATTETTTTEGTTEATTTNPPGRDLCKIYPLLPECRNIKSVHPTKKKQPSNVLQPHQKLSIKTEPHPVTSLCFYYPRLCMQPEEAQFVSLSDENGRPMLLISAADKKSVHSKGSPKRG